MTFSVNCDKKESGAEQVVCKELYVADAPQFSPRPPEEVHTVPEPSTLLLMFTIIIGGLLWQKHRS